MIEVSVRDIRLLAVFVTFALFGVACDRIDGPSTPVTPPASSTPIPSRTAEPDVPVSSTPGTRRTPTAVPTSGTPVAEAGRTLDLAPIESVEVMSAKSAPASTVIRVGSGLPNGCARYAGAAVEQRSAEVTVKVYNSMPTGNVACTAIYGYTAHDIVLGPLAPGVYKVRVNDRTVDLLVQ